MSPFEIIHSGLVTALLPYLTGSDVVQRDNRLRKFLRIFLSLPVSYVASATYQVIHEFVESLFSPLK